MKKKLRDFRNVVAGVVIGVALTATTAVSFAGTDNVKALFNRDIKFVVDGQSVKSSSPALMANNSTYLQLRDVANMFDYNVNYDGKTKTVTLTDKGDQVTTAPTTDKEKDVSNTGNTGSTTAPTPSNSDDLSTNKYAPQKLPITLTRGDGSISVTLNSITKDDENVYFNFNISNPKGQRFQVMGENSIMNEGLPNRKLFGVPTSSVFNNETDMEYQIKYKKEAFNKDVQNVALSFWLNYYAIGSKNWYTFKVDTTGLFE